MIVLKTEALTKIYGKGQNSVTALENVDLSVFLCTRSGTCSRDIEMETFMKLWGGRFEGDTDAMAKAFGDSIFFDKALYRYDIEGSIAHATMLGATGILSEADTDAIVQGLRGILADLEAGTLTVDESVTHSPRLCETYKGTIN